MSATDRRAEGTDLRTGAPICGCGLPMSLNPHPDAGNPDESGVAVGYVYECIPCLVATRNRVGKAWREAQAEINDGYQWMKALAEQTIDPGTGTLAWLHRNAPSRSTGNVANDDRDSRPLGAVHSDSQPKGEQ